MRQKMEFEKKIEQLLADLANVVTIVMAFITCYMADELLIYILVSLLVITIIKYILLAKRNKEMEKKLDQLMCDNAKKEQELADYKKNIKESKEKNDILNTRLQRVHDDLMKGKVSSDVLINYYIDEIDSQFVNFEKMSIKTFIHYKKETKLYDVSYCWEVKGQNPSKEKELSKLSFLISGDAIIKDNSELKMKVQVLGSDGKWKKIKGYSITGSDKIKCLIIQLGNYAVMPNSSFNIRFTYIWPRSYFSEGGDVFSFGTNTFSSVNPYSMDIQIRGDKKCFTAAKQEIRNTLTGGDGNKCFNDLVVYESDGENVVNVSLAASETNKSVYISLLP